MLKKRINIFRCQSNNMIRFLLCSAIATSLAAVSLATWPFEDLQQQPKKVTVGVGICADSARVTMRTASVAEAPREVEGLVYSSEPPKSNIPTVSNNQTIKQSNNAH